MKNTKIKTRILAALLFTSFIIIIALSTIHYFFEKGLAKTYTALSFKSINSIVKKYNETTNNLITPLSEKYLQLIVDDISDELLHIKHTSGNKLDNNILRKNKNLNQLMAFHTKKFDYIQLVVVDKSKIVLSLKPEYINKNYHQWLDECPDLIKKSETHQDYKGYYTFQIDNKPTLIYLSALHVKGTDYDVIAFLNLKQYLAPSNKIKAKKLEQELERLRNGTTLFLNKTLFYIGMVGLAITLLVIAVCVPVSLYFAATITKAIRILQQEIKEIGNGNFDIQIKEQGSLEIIDLIRGFNFLGQKLKQYVKNLEQEIEEKLFFKSQIKVAAKIQRSMLPEITEKFNNSNFSIGAQLNPAVYAAGDFYDFFHIADNKIAIVIADVSGKGIPAAFFMALSKTILRNICEKESSPAEALAKTNDILSTNNKEFMFVTVFLMYYDIETGKILYANAGHNEAIFMSSDKEYKIFGQHDNILIGPYKNAEYIEKEGSMSKGDTIILYTDGITEAISPEEKSFGESGLRNLAIKNTSLNPEDLCKKIIDEACKFEGNNDPFDDKTVVVLRRNK